MGVDITTLRDGDQPARHELRRQAFGRVDAYDPHRPMPPVEQVVAAYAGDRLVGAVSILDDHQYLGGRPVGCGGVANVGVVADHQGRGLARTMMREAFARMRGLGLPVSALYPTTATLYRSLGYELAGTNSMTAVEVPQLPTGDPSVVIEPAGYDAIRAVYDRVAPGNDGWLRRSDARWATLAHDFAAATDPKAVYVARRDGDAVGAIAYRQVAGERRFVDLSVSQLVAVDRAALRSLLGLLAAHGTMAGTARTPLPEWLVQPVVDHGQRLTRTFAMSWMLRLLDAPAAIAARGYRPEVSAEVHLELHDDVLPHHDGRWVLTVRDGEGQLEPGGRGELRVDIRELAAAYAGFPVEHPALATPFTGRPPSLVDFF
jgi:predicted acetyltransferase